MGSAKATIKDFEPCDFEALIRKRKGLHLTNERRFGPYLTSAKFSGMLAVIAPPNSSVGL